MLSVLIHEAQVGSAVRGEAQVGFLIHLLLSFSSYITLLLLVLVCNCKECASTLCFVTSF